LRTWIIKKFIKIISNKIYYLYLLSLKKERELETILFGVNSEKTRSEK